MDKRQAQQQIRDVFQNGFQRETYQHFIRNLLNQVEARDGHYCGNLIPEAFKEHINQYWRIGKYIDPDGTELDLLVVEVKSLAKLDRARTSLRNFAVNRLKKFDKACSLIAFYAKEDEGADWRFSFVKIEHGAFQDDKGKVKLKTELTPAKRYSYLVGVHENSHTAQDQLLDLLVMDYANPKIDDIEKAFSIEKVTAEFFEQYKGLYFKLSEQLTGQPFFQKGSDTEKAQAVARFAKKLLGQIVFLYFLQKKGWLGADQGQAWSTGPRRFMRQRFDQTVAASGNYYHDFLQYLFYEALADDRKGQLDPDYYPRFTCKIPFLNGGLFEAEYDWQSQSIALPDSIFHNNDKNKAGDEGTGILDVFDRYNFTIKEDEPLEKEVAVDPEMLGKVFENMLEGAERKSKGAFYTPREIVHYMCQESLIHYLDTSVNSSIEKSGQRDILDAMQRNTPRVPKKDIETLVRKGHLAFENDQQVLTKGRETDTYKFQFPESIRIHSKEIDQALADIKVCDPAIGSGAFPVGLLHEIVTTRLALAPHSGNQWSAYDLKRHTIRESLYGVDIDPSAIDIARLRLWLSLIVDEDDFSNIEALPNLDYKIMQGNSLVEEYWGVKLFNEEFIQGNDHDPNVEKILRLEEHKVKIDAEFLALLRNKQLTDDHKAWLEQETKTIKKSIKALRSAPKDRRQGLFDTCSEAKKKAEQLERLHKDFFSVNSPQRKKEIRQQITTLEWELIEATLAERNQLDSLAKLQQIKQTGEKPFFLWKLNFPEVFKENGGFDVVIGNPPYVQIQSFSGQQIQKDWEQQNYDTFAKTGDIYCLFYEKGHRLLRDNGALCFITSNKWMRANYGEKLRRFFCEKTNPLILIDFLSFHVFETATVDANVLLFEKTRNANELCACAINKDFTRQTNLESFVDRDHITLNKLSSESWTISRKVEHTIKKSIEAIGTPLKDWDISINYGIKTGFNEAFIVDGKTKDELIAKDPKNVAIIKPVLNGRDIKRYQVNFHDSWLLFIPWHFPLHDIPSVKGASLEAENAFKKMYPILYEYLVGFKENLSHRNKSETGIRYEWYALQRCAASYYKDFEKKRIVWGNLALSAQFALAEPDVFLNAPSNMITRGGNYLLAVLNSSVGDYYIRSLGVTRNGGYFEYKPMFVEKLPVPKLKTDEQYPYICLAEYVLQSTKKEQKLQSAYFEQLIDGLVYELYFPAEIKAANKEILKHLGDLTAITDAMSDAEKMAIIQTEFDRLYDPSHPVRNHLETLDSVEEVRIIREASKK